MEARVLGGDRDATTVICPSCGTKSEHEVQNGVPIAECPKCAFRLVLARSSKPQVVSR